MGSRKDVEDYDVSDVMEKLGDDEEEEDPKACEVHERPWSRGDLTKKPTDVLYKRGILNAEYTDASELYVCSNCEKLVSEGRAQAYERDVL